jgi:hypothetical protein
VWPSLTRHARPCAGHPRLTYQRNKTWMAGTSPAMTAAWYHAAGRAASAGCSGIVAGARYGLRPIAPCALSRSIRGC